MFYKHAIILAALLTPFKSHHYSGVVGISDRSNADNSASLLDIAVFTHLRTILLS